MPDVGNLTFDDDVLSEFAWSDAGSRFDVKAEEPNIEFTDEGKGEEVVILQRKLVSSGEWSKDYFIVFSFRGVNYGFTYNIGHRDGDHEVKTRPWPVTSRQETITVYELTPRPASSPAIPKAR